MATEKYISEWLETLYTNYKMATYASVLGYFVEAYLLGHNGNSISAMGLKMSEDSQ